MKKLLLIAILISVLVLITSCSKPLAGQAISGFSDGGCVEGAWVYLDGAGNYNAMGEGCTIQFTDNDVNGNPIPWCATSTVSTEGYDNVYITGNGMGTAWKECSKEEIIAQQQVQSQQSTVGGELSVAQADTESCVAGEWYVGKASWKQGGGPAGFKGPYTGCTKTSSGEGALSWCPTQTDTEEYTVYVSGGKQDVDWKYCDISCDYNEDCGEAGICTNGCTNNKGSSAYWASCLNVKKQGVCSKGAVLYNRASGNCAKEWYYQTNGGELKGAFKGCTNEDDSKYWCAIADSPNNKKSYALFDDAQSIGKKVCKSYDDIVAQEKSKDNTPCSPEGAFNKVGEQITHVCDKGKWLSLANFGVGYVTSSKDSESIQKTSEEKVDSDCAEEWYYGSEDGEYVSGPFKGCDYVDCKDKPRKCAMKGSENNAANTKWFVYVKGSGKEKFKYCTLTPDGVSEQYQSECIDQKQPWYFYVPETSAISSNPSVGCMSPDGDIGPDKQGWCPIKGATISMYIYKAGGTEGVDWKYCGNN